MTLWITFGMPTHSKITAGLMLLLGTSDLPSLARSAGGNPACSSQVLNGDVFDGSTTMSAPSFCANARRTAE